MTTDESSEESQRPSPTSEDGHKSLRESTQYAASEPVEITNLVFPYLSDRYGPLTTLLNYVLQTTRLDPAWMQLALDIDDVFLPLRFWHFEVTKAGRLSHSTIRPELEEHLRDLLGQGLNSAIELEVQIPTCSLPNDIVKSFAEDLKETAQCPNGLLDATVTDLASNSSAQVEQPELRSFTADSTAEMGAWSFDQLGGETIPTMSRYVVSTALSAAKNLPSSGTSWPAGHVVDMSPRLEQGLQDPAAKKGRNTEPWVPAKEHRLETLRDTESGWNETAQAFPTRTKESLKKHWYQDMHDALWAHPEQRT